MNAKRIIKRLSRQIPKLYSEFTFISRISIFVKDSVSVCIEIVIDKPTKERYTMVVCFDIWDKGLYYTFKDRMHELRHRLKNET